ncbi:MAG: guanylate kinase [Thermomicrobiales bacterium]|nr:guanylate kinase [Thermomicrobiales bacterium]MCO5222395.1 guanylate kinase [Thermomicrobiales bacterium]
MVNEGDLLLADLRNRRKPKLFVITGPSGAGKDTIVKELRETFPEVHVAVTATTRQRRPGEAEGVDYFFLDPDTFLERLANDEFMESAQVYGKPYGVPRNQIRHAIERGQDVLLKVDVQGAATIKERWPEAIVIFVSPGSMSQLLLQLRHRKTDNPEDLMRRFGEAESELPMALDFDYFVFNDTDRHHHATSEIESIIRAERLRTRQQSPVV